MKVTSDKKLITCYLCLVTGYYIFIPVDLLQLALIFLILLLSIFLAITGFQVFFILRDLKKALDRFNRILKSSANIAEDVEKPVEVTSSLVTGLAEGAKALTGIIKKEPKSKPKRFYKRTL